MNLPQEQRTKQIFAQHGIILFPGGPTQFNGDSPFAGPGKGEKKLYVNKISGLWDDKSSGISGNIRSFFAKKGALNVAGFRGTVALKLAQDRGLPMEALRVWNVGWDGRQYTIPAGSPARDLRRYTIGGKTQSSAGGNAALSGPYDPNSPDVFLCEGEWDGMAAWAMLRDAGRTASVLAAPGAGTFPQQDIPLFQGRRVRVLYDNDEAGKRGTAKVAKALEGVAAAVSYVWWPDTFPDGHDIRDFYKAGKRLEDLEALLKPGCPGGVTTGPTAEEELARLDGPGLDPEETIKRFRRFLYLPNPEVLDVLFGAVFANRIPGDPLWLLIVAPPGGTKTELIMSLADAPLIRTISSLTPRTLVSGGWTGKDAGSGGDPSLLPQLNGRVLCIKDFTTILSLPQQSRDEIFGTLREVYDGRFEKSWGTGITRRYDAKFGLIAGVTPIIEKYAGSSSVLGERFLKYRIPRTARIAGDNVIIDAALAGLNREAELRGGIRDAAKEVLNRPIPPEDVPTIPQNIRIRLRRLAQWVSSLRGVVSRERFSRHIEFRPTAEVGTRLAKQLAKLAQGVAVYRQKTEVGEHEYRIAVQVARGTVPDRVEDVIKTLFLREEEEERLGVPPKAGEDTATGIASSVRSDSSTIRAVMEDLELLRVVYRIPAGGKGWKVGVTRYRLSKALRALAGGLGLYTNENKWREARAQKEGADEVFNVHGS